VALLVLADHHDEGVVMMVSHAMARASVCCSGSAFHLRNVALTARRSAAVMSWALER